MKVNSPSVKVKCRVISYIDGFNLYFGLRANDWRKYMWLDLTKLSEALLLNNQALQHTKYFTSRVRGNVGKSLPLIVMLISVFGAGCPSVE